MNGKCETIPPGQDRFASFTVSAAQARIRLDALAAAELKISRARAKKLITQGQCQIDGAVCLDADQKTRAGQKIRLEITATESSLQAEPGKLEIVWRDESLVVVNKPAGLTVHPCPSCPKGTLVQSLLAQFPELSKMEGFRPGIVHRLDKDTSGLLVVALNEDVRLKLAEGFARREVGKTYLALTRGVPAAAGRIDLPLGRHPRLKTKMAVVPEPCGGKPALSEWQTMYADSTSRFALLSVIIHSGRTHQIRVHLSEFGHPLWGDKLYTLKNAKPNGNTGAKTPANQTFTQAPRQMLHAWRLRFQHPVSGESFSFQQPPPADFLTCALTLHNTMQRVILTGTPGSGKSTVLKQMKRAGLPIWSADQVVAELYRPGHDGWNLLRQRYGDRFIHAGSRNKEGVNRTALIEAMRSQPSFRRELGAAIHPLVFASLNDFFAAAEAAGSERAVAEVPLWHENGGKIPGAIVVSVVCPAENRAARLAADRGWTPEKTSTVASWQWPEADKIKKSHFALENSGSERELAEKTQNLLSALAQLKARETDEFSRRLTELWGKPEFAIMEG